MNHYLFIRLNETTIRVLNFKEVDGYKTVASVLEMTHSPNKESLKKTVRTVYDMMLIGEETSDYTISASYKEYDASLEGKASKKISKEINVIIEQLFATQ